MGLSVEAILAFGYDLGYTDKWTRETHGLLYLADKNEESLFEFSGESLIVIRDEPVLADVNLTAYGTENHEGWLLTVIEHTVWDGSEAITSPLLAPAEAANLAPAAERLGLALVLRSPRWWLTSHVSW